jgi:GT2 family glycosyltransferase
MNTYAVTVTYGNRFSLLKRVIDELFSQKIHRVVVVDNHSSSESRAALDAFAAKTISRLTVLHMQANTGSASGYKQGIDFARKQHDCDFIWLLDDDNLPESNALNELKTVWNEISCDDKSGKLCLASFRADRPAYLQAVYRGRPELVLGEKNMFRSFHTAMALRLLAGRFNAKKIIQDKGVKRYGPVSVTTYGGMFFHKHLIDLIGLPDESYYLYVDDHEYSYRISRKGGMLYLVPASRITDIDKSWHVGNDMFAFKKIALDENFIRLYYSVRNRVYFEKCELVTNRAVYLLNVAIYSLFVCTTAVLHSRFRNCAIYLKALYRGWKGQMGIEPDFKLQ